MSIKSVLAVVFTAGVFALNSCAPPRSVIDYGAYEPAISSSSVTQPEPEQPHLETVVVPKIETPDAKPATSTYPAVVIEERVVVERPQTVTEPSRPAYESKPVVAETPMRYYIIVGSFSDMSNALNQRAELTANDFKAGILTENGLNRVYAGATNDRRTAEETLSEVRLLFPDAWLYTRR